MESKQILCDQSPPSSRYQSFIARNLESYRWCGIKEPQGKKFRACFHGWAILSDDSDDDLWSLWNPLTSKLIHLPPLVQEEEDSYDCCLSSPPSDQSSVFLLFSCKTPTIVFCRLDIKRKGLKWTKMSYDEQLRSISGIDGVLIECPTCYNGKVYAMTTDLNYRLVIQVDIMVKCKEVVIRLLQFVEVPSANTRFPTRHNFSIIYTFLKGTCRELFYIEVRLKDETRIGGVSVFKLDTTSTLFEKMEDLKDAIFFVELSTSSLFYKSAVLASEVGGYVHVLDKMEKMIHSYYVKDRTMSLSLMPCTLEESQVFVWTMLECRLEVDSRVSKQEEKDKDIEIVIRKVKPNENESDSKTSESRLLNVPLHVLEVIMEHCVGVEYLKFRATCKRCLLAAPQIQWSNETRLRRLQMYSVASPWLMVLDNYQGTITFIDPIFGDKYFIEKPGELNGDCNICYSRCGWLLVHTINPRPQLWFFNPFTSNIHTLPEMPCCLRSLCFSAPPTSPDCIVVGFSRKHAYFHFVSQEPEWRRYDLDTGSNDPYSFPITTLSFRDLYVLCNNERIEAFRNIGKEDFSRMIVVDKVPTSSCTSVTDYFLSSCDQHLLLVIVCEVEESVEVFKLNDSTKEWEKIDSLGKHTIYISYSSCFCLEAKSPEMENKIYFPRLLHNNDTKIAFYSMETRQYHTFDCKNIQESLGVSLSETKHHCNPHTWIEPSWS